MTQKTSSDPEQEIVVEEPALFKEASPSKSGAKKFWLFVILAASGLMIFFRQEGVKGTAVLKSEQFAQIGLINPGVLKKLFHRKGDSVQAGEELARFENPDIANQTREKEASLEILGHDRSRLEKKMQFFEKEFERKTILYENGVTAKAVLDSAESDLFQVKEEFAMRQKEYETVKSEIRFFKERMASLELKAPFAGVILSDPKEKIGNFLREGEFVIELADPGTFYLELPVPEKDVQKLKEGNRVSIRFSAFPWRSYRGRIIRINPKVKEETEKVFKIKHVVPCDISLDEIPNGAKYGMQAFVKIQTGIGKAVSLFKHDQTLSSEKSEGGGRP